MSDRHSHGRGDATAKTGEPVHTQSLDWSRAFLPAQTKAIAVVDTSVTVSISPLDSKESKMRITVKEAEEAKGRKYQDEGKVGRQGESLETEDRLPEYSGREEAEEEAGKREVDVPELGKADRPEYEVCRHRIARRPVLPTKAEIDEHYPFHLNYRSLCAH